jgi:hypothetical protein
MSGLAQGSCIIIITEAKNMNAVLLAPILFCIYIFGEIGQSWFFHSFQRHAVRYGLEFCQTLSSVLRFDWKVWTIAERPPCSRDFCFLGIGILVEDTGTPIPTPEQFLPMAVTLILMQRLQAGGGQDSC